MVRMAPDPARIPRTVVSLRLDPTVLARVTARAAAHGVSRTALVERYILEGMHRDDHPLIDFRSRHGMTAACVAGRRLEVRHVIGQLRAHGGDRAATAADLGVGLHIVDACAAYYGAHREQEDAYAAAVAARSAELMALDLAAEAAAPSA